MSKQIGTPQSDQSAILALTRRVAELETDNDDMREALRRIVQWADAYPLDVFPMPDWKKAREGLATVGITLDSVSAANMRHVVEGVGKIAKDAMREGKE